MIKFEKPTLKDIPQVQKVLYPFVKEGIVLKRDDDEVATNIRSYIVAKSKEKIVGVGALHIFSAELGEIRSLAVDRNFQKQKLGTRIVQELEKEAKKLGLNSIITLTYQKEFFESLNFKEIPKERVPSQKVWSDCIKCRHFPNCNEVLLIKTF